jgi:hypothetical protein
MMAILRRQIEVVERGGWWSVLAVRAAQPIVPVDTYMEEKRVRYYIYIWRRGEAERRTKSTTLSQ